MTWLWPALLLLVPLACAVGILFAPAGEAQWMALAAGPVHLLHR